jgi:2-polyprenyl-3-methyl-5-hydroxy-6-metoxy-1,4-benzoquinol methylase
MPAMARTDDVYTHGHDEVVLAAHRRRTVATSAAYLLSHLTPGATVLDVGCGPGSLTVDLARHVAPGGLVVGIDVSADAVASARALAAEAGMGDDRVRFVTGDVRDAEPGGEPGVDGFDVVHAHQVLQHLRDPVAFLATLGARARPGGVVAVRDADYPAMTWAPEAPGLARWLEIYRAVTARNGADCAAGRRLLAWAHAAGLSDATYTTSTWTFATPDDRAWWGGSWAERITSSQLAAQAVDYGVATRAELAEVAAAWRAWAADPDAVFFVPHGEVVARA